MARNVMEEESENEQGYCIGRRGMYLSRVKSLGELGTTSAGS